MKKFLTLAAFLVGFVGVSHAAIKTPKDDQGITLPTIDLAGAKACTVSNSTGTNAVLCTAGPALVYGVIASSDAIGNFMLFRDSATANTSSTVNMSVWNQGNGTTQVAASTVIQKLPVPLYFTNGVSVNLNAAASPVTGFWTVLYRKLDGSN